MIYSRAHLHCTPATCIPLRPAGRKTRGRVPAVFSVLGDVRLCEVSGDVCLVRYRVGYLTQSLAELLSTYIYVSRPRTELIA